MSNCGWSLIVVVAIGCGSVKQEPVSRSNELSFTNRSDDSLSKVVVEWGDKSFTITNEDRALEGGSRSIKNLPIRKPLETTLKITVHFPPEREETLVHEEKVSLDPKERKLIEVTLNQDGKLSVHQKQRNPSVSKQLY